MRAFFDAHTFYIPVHHACHKTIPCPRRVYDVGFEERHPIKHAVLIAIRPCLSATYKYGFYIALCDFFASVQSGLLVRNLNSRQNFRFVFVRLYTVHVFDFIVCDFRLFCGHGIEEYRHFHVFYQKVETFWNIRVRNDALCAVDDVEFRTQKFGSEPVENIH